MLTAEQVLHAIRSKVDHPSTVRELMSRLRLPPEQQVALRRRLASLVEAGDLIKVRGNRYGLPDRMRLVTGRVQVHPRGFGFVTPDQPITGIDGDLFIAGARRSPVGDRGGISVDVERAVAEYPGVTAVDGFRSITVPYRDSTIIVGSGRFDVLLAHGNLLFKSPADGRTAKVTGRTTARSGAGNRTVRRWKPHGGAS